MSSPSSNPSSEELDEIFDLVAKADRYVEQRDSMRAEAKRRLQSLIDAARIDENQRRLDKIIAWENRKPVPGELTSASFGSAGAGMEVAGFKRSFEERIAELKPPTAEQPTKLEGE